MKTRLIFLVIITFLGFFVRFYNLTTSPEGLYIDETSIGYNAYSLLQTGKDEHGQSWPLFFEAFGEWKLPVYIYSVVIGQLFLGPTDASVRIPAVLFGTFSVPLMYFFVKEILSFWRPKADRILDELQKRSYRSLHSLQDDIVPLLSAFLLAISPWHFQFTHAGFEASGAVFFMLLGLVLFLKATHLNPLLQREGIPPLYKRRLGGVILICSLLAFVATLYTYNSARVVTPLLLLCLVVFYWKSFSFKQWILAVVFGLVVAAPFISFAFSPAGFVRAAQVSIFHDKNIENPLGTFVSNYWKNISPTTLFIQGESTIAHLTPHRMSLLYLVELPFLLIGLGVIAIYGLVKDLKSLRIIEILLVIGFIPPAVTTLNPHALRGFMAVPALVVISAMGFGWVLRHSGRGREPESRNLLYNTLLMRKIPPFLRLGGFSRDDKKLTFFITSIYVSMLLFSTFRFLTIYHTKYTKDAGWDWQVDIKRASRAVKKFESDYEQIYFQEAGAAKIAFAWYLKIPPALFQKNTNVMGKYAFGVNEIQKSAGKNLYVAKNPLIEGKLVKTIYYPNGSEAYALWEK